MTINIYNHQEDYQRIIDFLTDQYKVNKNMVCWLPARFDDLVFRIDTLYHDERGGKKSADYIYIFADNDEIIGIILPDGDSFNSCLKTGYESIFSQMLNLAEKELRPLFTEDKDGKITFLVVSHDSLEYQAKELQSRGYTRDEAGDYDNVQHPKETNYEIELPVGYKLVYGENIPEIVKIRTCHYGFHPEDDNGNLYEAYVEGGPSYQARKKSQFYQDSFETLIMTDEGDYCCYCFCYVDKKTNTAFIEPLSTREKYRMKGLAKQMLHRVIIKLKAKGIKNAYINSFDWRVKVYNSAGFITEDTIGFWHKKL